MTLKLSCVSESLWKCLPKFTQKKRNLTDIPLLLIPEYRHQTQLESFQNLEKPLVTLTSVGSHITSWVASDSSALVL